MSIIGNILEQYNIPKNKKDINVDPELGTIKTIVENDEYSVGNFIKRLLKRIELVDDFRTEYIACAQFIPEIRKISIILNPLLIWDMMLRQTAKKSLNLEDHTISRMDTILLEGVKNGGWTNPLFGEWIKFLLSKSVTENNRSSRNRDTFQTKNEYHNDFVNSILSVIIHEVLHIMWNHISFQRMDTSGTDKDKHRSNTLSNIAQDFAINQTLDFGLFNETFMTTSNSDLLFCFYDGGAIMKDPNPSKKLTHKSIVIDDFDTGSLLNQPFEYYLDLLKKAEEKNVDRVAGKTIPGSMFAGGNIYDVFKHVFGEGTKEEQEQFKKEIQDILAGEGVSQFEEFNQQSSDMKKVSSNDLKRVIDEMLEKGEIEDPRDICNQHPFSINGYFSKVINGLYPTNTCTWEHILAHYTRKAMGAEDTSYSMNRESRSSPDMFPGKQRLEGLDLAFVTDVSGSINLPDFNQFINEMVKITQDIDMPYVRYMQFHSEVAFDDFVPISSLKSIGIASTGGTCLGSALNKLKDTGNKSLTIVFTDGYVEDISPDGYDFDIILFISTSGKGHASETLRTKGFTVINQDGDNEWFSDA